MMRLLYKISTLVLFLACFVSASAQVRTVTFTGRDRTNLYHIPLSKVIVFNLDQLWEEVLYYPDTTLTLGTVSVDDHNLTSGIQLMQNVPNPFDGTTEFALVLPEDRDVLLEIYDISGRLSVGQHFSDLSAGTHLFQATLASPQTYLLSAKVDDGQMTIKMVNEGHGAGNTIRHLGMTDANGDFTLYLKNDKYSSGYPFNVGDEMKYIGYAVIDGAMKESNIIQRQQLGSETVYLQFNVTAPSVTTSAANNITSTTASCGGNVTATGDATVTERGVCWSVSHNPTLSNSHTTNGGGIGNFTSSLTGLTSGTTYYVRAYATNGVGTAYGEEKSFTTLSLPTVTTNIVTNITSTTATCGGNVTSGGGTIVTARGVCWSTSQNPTISGSYTSNGTGIGNFTSNITGLAPNTTYYVRAYATNSVGTAYGEQKTFTTLPVVSPVIDEKSCPVAPTVTDHEGNVYATVQIGNQCWMRDNLRTTTSPSTGTYLIPTASTGYTFTGKQARWYNNDSATYVPMNYGLLYNWNAAVDTFNTAYGETNVNTEYSNAVFVTFSGYRRGICPAGWHLPSDTEWMQLTDYVSSQSGYVCGGDNSYIAKSLVSTTGWNSYSGSCYPGDQSVTANNATGFSAVPAGGCYGSSFTFNDAGHEATFWSTAVLTIHIAFFCHLSYNNAEVGCGYTGKPYEFSVRCLRDETGTAVVDEKSCPAAPTVTDHEGNVYATVQIGNQCWMRDNLRTTTSPSTGTYLIPSASTGYTFTGKQARWYNNDSATYAPMNYGLLYNWNAAVDTFNTAYGETSVSLSYGSDVSVTFSGHRRGICPAGWHLPSDAEWTTMTDYVSSQSEYVCGGNTSYIAKVLADSFGWNSSTNTCAVGNNQSANNVTGFSAVPAGYCNGSSFYGAGNYAHFWSATQRASYPGNLSYGRLLLYNYANVGGDGGHKGNGYSVRCLRD